LEAFYGKAVPCASSFIVLQRRIIIEKRIGTICVRIPAAIRAEDKKSPFLFLFLYEFYRFYD
jgi:hypothetical protein